METGGNVAKQPISAHIRELQKRLFVSVGFLLFFSGIGYALYPRLVQIIQRPLGQVLYYTSPSGGINFVFKISLLFGFVMTLPIIIFQLVKFLTPLTKKNVIRGSMYFVTWSMLSALACILFAYFVSLPAALNFLTHFGGDNIKSLITADEYFNFAISYLLGFALLFQLPLIVLFINRITPLKPSSMMKKQRYIILGSFILAAILTPTPDPLNQVIMASPVIVLYQFSVLLVMVANRKLKIKHQAAADARSNNPAVITPLGLAVSVKRPTVALINDFVRVQPDIHLSPTAHNQTTAIAPLKPISSPLIGAGLIIDIIAPNVLTT